MLCNAEIVEDQSANLTERPEHHFTCELLCGGIAELTAPALAETGATVERVLEELTCLAFYNVTQILESDDDGLTMKDPRTLPKDLSRSMISFKPIQVGEKTSYECKFADKLRALEALARYLKMFNNTVVVENVFQVIQEMSDEELDRRLAELEIACKAA